MDVQPLHRKGAHAGKVLRDGRFPPPNVRQKCAAAQGSGPGHVASRPHQRLLRPVDSILLLGRLLDSRLPTLVTNASSPPPTYQLTICYSTKKRRRVATLCSKAFLLELFMPNESKSSSTFICQWFIELYFLDIHHPTLKKLDNYLEQQSYEQH